MTAASRAVRLVRPPLRSRLWGLGSVYGKTIRDSRRAIILAAAMIGVLVVGVAAAIAQQFNTPASRLEIVALINSLPPILAGLGGPIVNVGTMGGYLQYKYGSFFPLLLSLWSILALSGTLAAEARRGSLEFVTSAPLSRMRVALEKVGAHLTGLAVVFIVTVGSVLIAGAKFGSLPGDELNLTQAIAYALWMILMALAAGSVAFALAPFIGRGAAAGIAGFLTLVGFIVTGYSAPVPELAPIAELTWSGWTVNHLPLAGQFDWLSVAFLAIFVVIMLVVGLVAFSRRDIGVTSTVPSPSLPLVLVGLRGPVGRAIGNNLAAAIAWGLGIGLFGLLLAGAAKSFVDQLGNSPDFRQLLNMISPTTDFGSVGGFLQLLFIELGIIMVGLAAATLVAGWASEETSGRLEMVLATPVSRIRWALGSAAGLLVDMLLIVFLVGMGIAIGGATTGGDLLTPILGSLVLVFYGAALIGIGLAVGGLIGSRFAAPATVIVVLLTWFVQILGPLLHLPDFIQQLALTNHYGQPMVGNWDFGGIGVSIVVAAVGITVGAWGMARRDLRG